jgi:tetratricopeptide (TPR) repeat protein
MKEGYAGAYLLCAMIPTLAVLWIADDSNLGYARNWDLLAMFGFVLAVAGVYFLVEWLPHPATRQRVVIAAIAISLLHTLAWVGLNASTTASMERFARLPLGLGRVESTLGVRYLNSGELDKAEEWFTRALEESPWNVRAHYFMGMLYLRTDRPEAAIEAFQHAVSVRPDRQDFQLGLLDALVRSGRWDEAAGHLSRMISQTPTADALWVARALLMARVGQWDQALESAQRSALLWEGHVPYVELQAAIGRHAEFSELMYRYWPEVSGLPWPPPTLAAGAHIGRRSLTPCRVRRRYSSTEGGATCQTNP